MKYKYIFLIVLGISIFSGATMLVTMQSNSSPLKLIVKSNKETYKLGEIVHLSFELKNISSKDAFIGEVFGVGGGSLTVHVSKDSKNFPEYSPGWGIVDFSPQATLIKPNKSIATSASVLWHLKPNALDGESNEVINEVGKKKLLTTYAFPEPGNYFVKAIFRNNLESEPIQITIEKPQGEDLEVWNKIKDDGNFAYFIQINDFLIPSYKTEEREKFKQKVEKIINTYPNSFYAQSLRQSLEKFNANQAKRQEFLQKLEKQN